MSVKIGDTVRHKGSGRSYTVSRIEKLGGEQFYYFPGFEFRNPASGYELVELPLDEFKQALAKVREAGYDVIVTLTNKEEL